VANNNTEIFVTSLAPSLPCEATFEDAVAVNDFAFLAPVTPAVADFEEVIDYQQYEAALMGGFFYFADIIKGICR